MAVWVYAAKWGGRARRYPWGDEAATCARAVMSEGGYGVEEDWGCGMGGRPWPVCSKPAGHSAQGVCDLAGNVWEWCSDWYARYPPTPQRDPAGPERGADRVLRGGSWFYPARNLRASVRNWNGPGYRYRNVGFRVVRPAPEP